MKIMRFPWIFSGFRLAPSENAPAHVLPQVRRLLARIHAELPVQQAEPIHLLALCTAFPCLSVAFPLRKPSRNMPKSLETLALCPALLVLHEFEREGAVHVLQRALVVVAHRQQRLRLFSTAAELRNQLKPPISRRFQAEVN